MLCVGRAFAPHLNNRIELRRFMQLPADPERFKNLTEGIKNIVLAAAVLIGGTWTAYTFWSLKSAELAQLEYDQKRERRPALEVSLASDLMDAEIDDYEDKRIGPKRQLFIQVLVTVKNTGNYPALVDLSKESLVVSRLNSGTTDRPLLTGSRSFNVLGAQGKIDAFFLSPGNQTTFPYLVDVKYSGLHVVEFKIPQDPRVLEVLQSRESGSTVSSTSKANLGHPVQLTATTLVYVPSDRIVRTKL